MVPALVPGQALAALPQAVPVVSAQRVPDETIRVDGKLLETSWAEAEAATGFRQREPLEGEPATETTEVRVLFDGATLFIGVLARDSEPGAVIARLLQRDRVMAVAPFEGALRFGGDDGVAILLDPFNDDRNAVVFATNPNGAEFDALITDEGRELNVDWRAVWRVAANRTDEGWSAEFAIPFRSLRFPPGGGGPWGFNVYRVIRRKNEEVLLSAWSRSNEGFERVSRAAELHGLEGLPAPGANIELKPYVLSGAVQELVDDVPGSRDTDPRLEVGFDAKYQVTSGLLLDVTANTDFAQVEVDDERVNLTRFDLFFPEKRDFFLENAGIFEFGFRSFFEPPPFLLFFSRRIGIHDDGEVPVIGGSRLTGRVGRQTLGLLDVVTESAFAEPRTNFAVARVKRDVGSSGFWGVMLTDRRNRDDANTTAGLDWSIWPGATVQVDGFLARTWTRDAGGEGTALRVGLDWQEDRYGINGMLMSIGPETNAELGFITRTDINRLDLSTRYTPRPRILGLRKIDVMTNVQVVTRTDRVIQDWAVGPIISPEWGSGESLALFALRGFTRIDEAFDLHDDVEVPAGDYQAWAYGAFFNTSTSRRASLQVNAFLQETFGGRVDNVDTKLTLAPNANLNLTAGYSYNLADVPGGRFRADVLSLRLGVAFSTRLTANTLVQYNSLEDELSANLRINFIHAPGSDLFLVFNEKRGSDTSVWDFSERGAVVKLTWLKRL